MALEWSKNADPPPPDVADTHTGKDGITPVVTVVENNTGIIGEPVVTTWDIKMDYYFTGYPTLTAAELAAEVLYTAAKLNGLKT